MMEPVVQHQRSDPQTRRGSRGDHQRHERIGGADVIERVQLVVAQRFGLTRRIDQCIVVVERACLESKPERPGHHAKVTPSAKASPRLFRPTLRVGSAAI